MATAVECSLTDQIGNVAGQVWHSLASNGRMSLAKLTKDVDEPRDLVMQAVGWLAREDKLDIEETPRGRVVSLRS